MNYLMFLPISYVAVEPAKKEMKTEKKAWFSSFKLFFMTIKN